MTPLDDLKSSLQPYREKLIQHPLYESINDLRSLQIFMSQHVFAVWDFMSLLKALQQRLTSISSPWLPPQNPLACRLVNEIVLGEESDEDGSGGYASHFDLYHRAMEDCGGKTDQIDRLLELLGDGADPERALEQIDVSPAARQFNLATFRWISRGDLLEIAAAFTFGREDLLPDIFRKIVEQINRESTGQLQSFLYYLDRHIELDEDRHGPMADRLMIDICGENTDQWRKAEQVAIRSLELRCDLWDEITAKIVRYSHTTC